MKNFLSTNSQISYCFLTFILFLIATANHSAKAQSFCQTTGGDGAIGIIPSSFNFPSSVNGPLFLRIYVHAVGKDDGSDAPAPEQLRESISILETDFTPHNIFFVWDCNIIPINSSALYNASGFTNVHCELGQYSNHPDGQGCFVLQ